MSQCIAREEPIRFGSDQLRSCSAISPRLLNAGVSLTPSAAKRMSQEHAMERPIPAAAPLMAAMIGFGTVLAWLIR